MGVVAGWIANDQRRARQARRRRSPFPIATVPATEIDPAFEVNEFGPTLDTEVSFVGRGAFDVPGGTSDAEAWILAVLAKHTHRFFEFGTCTGKTAYLVARNSPADARIDTITLPPDQHAEYVSGEGDTLRNKRHALRDSVFSTFLYSGTAVEPKIHQLFGDSKAFDESPYLDACDLVFVDGSHAYSYAASDSAKAMRMVRPGGLVIWHDYVGDEEPGVFRALNEIATQHRLVHVEGTTLAVYRRPN